MEVHGKLKYLKEHQEIVILVRAVISDVSEPRVEEHVFVYRFMSPQTFWTAILWRAL